MAPVYDVFLSHSTADKPAVEELARKLVEAGIKPFFDKWELIPGESSQESLEKALDESRTCAVFVGSASLGPWQNEEMRSAIDEWVGDKTFRVIPVLLPGAPDPRERKMPRFLRRPTWVDFRAGLNDGEAFRSLISGIQGKPPGPGDSAAGELIPSRAVASPYRCMAQPPEGFIHRGEYEKVLEALCPGDGIAQASPAAGLTMALQGAGGFGKTSLAQAICLDERVRRHYPDGILWTTMGENLDSENRLSRILDLIRWWTDKEPPGFKDFLVAGAKLREILKGRRILLVVDDVWSAPDVTPFQGLGNGSAGADRSRCSGLPRGGVPSALGIAGGRGERACISGRSTWRMASPPEAGEPAIAGDGTRGRSRDGGRSAGDLAGFGARGFLGFQSG
ncbi:MAG: TIR domain-containing protein [Acidobacteria bacterium]|nr:TIR domain-containing protein [Acidobacteriota bacterium]